MNEKKINKLLILSFPRSGSVFLQYCLQYCMKTFKVNQSPHLGSIVKYLKGFELEDKVQILKHHHFDVVSKHDQSDVFTIFMLRDFKECIPSHCLQENTQDYQSYVDVYCDELLNYCAWKNQKHLVYYEDFINDPVKELDAIVCKLNSDYQHMVDRLKVDIEELSHQSLVLKKKVGSPSLSGGARAVFHKQKLQQDEIDNMVAYIKKRLNGTPAIDFLQAYFN